MLGLREGDEAVGWQEAWSEAVRLSVDKMSRTEDEQLSAFSDLPLSEEAGADFDRIVRAKLASPNVDEPNTPNTTLKPPPPPSELSFNSLPKHAISGPSAISIEILGERRSCISDGVASFISESDNEIPLGGSRHIKVGGYSPPLDECIEAQRAVFAQHRAVTMKHLIRISGRNANNLQVYHNHLSTLANPTSISDDTSSLSRFLQHSESLHDIPCISHGFENPLETALFEQVGLLSCF